MAEKEKYYIAVGGQQLEVSKQIYEAYSRGRRKEHYFMYDLKEQRTRINKNTGKAVTMPSREDSYERLIEAEKQFTEESVDVEDMAVRAVMLEKLNEALHTLNEEERKIIHALFYQEISEVDLAEQMGVARTTLQSRKYKIFEKLKKML